MDLGLSLSNIHSFIRGVHPVFAVGTDEKIRMVIVCFTTPQYQ